MDGKYQRFELDAGLIRLNAIDSVAVATKDLRRGDQETIDGKTICLRRNIPSGHKVAIVAIDAGQPVLKYGQPIGIASQAIVPGDHVHSDNLVDHHTVSGDLSAISPPPPPPAISRVFEGFHRPDGRVGTRNYVCLMSTVNCSATVCHQVAKRFTADRMKRWPNVDGVFAATHTTGCAMQYNGIKHQMLGRVLAGYARHPNVGGTLVIGLGCEQTTSGYLAEHHGVVSLYSPDGTLLTRDDGMPMLTMQTEGGTRATIEKADALLEQVLDRANQFTRKTADASHLNLAVECGGSDGYSGLTANPAVGVVSDRVVACGGTSVISETTELYGAEHLLVGRSRSADVAQALLDRIEWWKQHVATYGGQIDNNPSVGNKAGGLTTITEKSLGAVSKSGSTAIEAFYQYAEPVTSKGMVVMDSPGFDPSSVTGKVAGGANLVMFTTGRGSCFGCKPTPVIKIATNTPMFESLQEDMDLDAGPVLAGEDLQSVGDRFFDFALEVASGKLTHSEELGFGDHEFVPWTVGPTL
ncbi:Altronate dehydratase [Rubripirellula lacrimiformis]|uniref:Altronate dehydratase n=1 Tax=Rubripirellula lacrimiformis TaxID=1930273 RepID=A0A517N7Q7_9BACT|nr:altronate dehydratase family protein [Rubripirellula lacrimiformis]QDT03174.1 Altronate dehydratase [Rubripirellula lacrimiformis]